MILKALHDYYHVLVALGKKEAAPFGVDWVNISFIIVIDKNGTFKYAESTDSAYLLPSDKTRTGAVVSYVLWDKSSYVLGLPSKKDETHIKEKFESFQEEIRKIYKEFPKNDGFKAIYRFYEKKQYLVALQDKTLKKAKGAWIAFRLSTTSDPHQLIGSDEDARQYRISDESNRVSIDACCMITGKRESIAKTHKGIKISRDNPPLISFQTNSGYDSYGKEQGANSPISERASDAIAKGLNILLEWGRNTNYKIGDTTFVFWSTLQKDDLLTAFKSTTFTGEPSDSDLEDVEKATSSSSDKPKKKQNPEKNVRVLRQALEVVRGYQSYMDKDLPDRFYILGLTPNRSRLSVKLWMEGTVREIVSNTLQHLEDMNIVNHDGLGDELNPPLRPFKSIFKAILSIPSGKKESDISYPPHIVQSLLESIVKGLPYPVTIKNACLERIRHERSKKDEKGGRLSPITEMRVALLKASFNRKHRNNDNIKKLTMALDPTNDTPAYLAGRLFFILEDVQKQAISYDINSSIADRYFIRAAGDPNVVFGELLGKANYHLRKLERSSGKPHFARTEIEAILDLLPKEVISQRDTQGGIKHGLDGESLFAIGYYHQRAEYRRRRAENREKKDAEKNQHSTGSGSED
nr:type I-C CRISPR-associated protein Cas8c/Csd1 [uncultured Porphyromonas sp.]